MNKKIFTALLLSTAFSASALSGCGEAYYKFSKGQEIINEEFERETLPIYIKLDDHNIIRVSQVAEGRIEFAKTSEGYAEFGVKGHALGASVGVDWSQGKIFTKISALEALALCDNDWTKIAYPIYEQNCRLGHGGTTQVGALLFLLSVPDRGGRKLSSAEFLLAGIEARGSALDCDQEMSDAMVKISGNGKIWHINGLRTHMFIRLSDFNLMCVTQVGDQLEFSVTSNGYGVQGAEVAFSGIGVGAEAPFAHQYDVISPLLALTLLDNDWSVVYDAAVRQNQIFEDTVSPALVRKALQPLAEGHNNTFLVVVVDPERSYIVDVRDKARTAQEIIVSNRDTIFPSQYFEPEEVVDLIVSTTAKSEVEIIRAIEEDNRYRAQAIEPMQAPHSGL